MKGCTQGWQRTNNRELGEITKSLTTSKPEESYNFENLLQALQHADKNDPGYLKMLYGRIKKVQMVAKTAKIFLTNHRTNNRI